MIGLGLDLKIELVEFLNRYQDLPNALQSTIVYCMTVLEATVEKLKILPEDKIEAVAHYIDTLNTPQTGRFGDLAGCMATEEVDKMERAIKATCERIDEW